MALEAEKYRARIVTRGFQQKEGIDYAETYAPVVKFNTLSIFFAIVAYLNLHCHQMDVKTAFLNGDLEHVGDRYLRDAISGHV